MSFTFPETCDYPNCCKESIGTYCIGHDSRELCEDHKLALRFCSCGLLYSKCGDCSGEEFDEKYPDASCLRCEKQLDSSTLVECGGGDGACETWYCKDCHREGTDDCPVCYPTHHCYSCNEQMSDADFERGKMCCDDPHFAGEQREEDEKPTINDTMLLFLTAVAKAKDMVEQIKSNN